MKKAYRISELTVTAIVLLWLNLVFLDSSALAQTANATNNTVVLTAEGTVQSSIPSGQAWVPAKVNQMLKDKEWIRTGFKSRASVQLVDQSMLRMNQLTTIQIVFPAGEPNKRVLDLKKGATYFFNREKPIEAQFSTPQASGAISGTEFNLAVGDDGMTVVTMMDGSVTLSNQLGRVDLTSGEQGIVEPGQAPRKTAVIDAINIIQWALYYPGVIDLSDLELNADDASAIKASVDAYRTGDLLKASSEYPTNRTATIAAEIVYAAGLFLANGQVDQSMALLKTLPANTTGKPAQLANALRHLVASVKNQEGVANFQPALASEWLAASYYEQSKYQLDKALKSAQQAVALSPNFGFGWVRVAELEFSFGRIDAALAALDKGLQLTPRNAQGHALKGFLLAAQNKIKPALACFDEAIQIDGALGNAWLGRGLCKIKSGKAKEGRADLMAAAVLEPSRAILRSYLGKAYSNEFDKERAAKEIELAIKLDPNDPTSWLYSALLAQQGNQLNKAVNDLEKSKELNDNRQVYRSRMMLDQDKAVRSANLAAIYRDNGMTDYSVREASRGVNSDYANYSSHLFLANSFDSLRDPKQVNLRYDTPWLSELLIANLLAPVGAGSLSQNISQQEYSKLLERDRIGLSSFTEYSSRGNWYQNASQFGTFKNLSYAFDVIYRSDEGFRPNNDVEALTWHSKIKMQLSPQDDLMFHITYYDYEAGDVAQYFDQSWASSSQRLKEKQEPMAFIGYHHEWQPGVHTLFLAGRLSDEFSAIDPNSAFMLVSRNAAGDPLRVAYQPQPTAVSNPFGLNYVSELEAYTTELQQIWQQNKHTLIGGLRYQNGFSDTTATVRRTPSGFPPVFVDPVSDQTFETDIERFNAYVYEKWQITQPFSATVGLSYDHLNYPYNIDIVPISNQQRSKDQVSPKAGFIWDWTPKTHFRGSFTRSLGGAFLDSAVRLEPTQVAGFIQSYRSLLPESVAGQIAASEFTTWDVSLDHEFRTKTYAALSGQLLSSEGERGMGVYDWYSAGTAVPGSVTQSFDYEEKSLFVVLNQLLADEWSLGLTYRLTDADVTSSYLEIPPGTPHALNTPLDRQQTATLNQLSPYLIYNHRCGFFGQFITSWNHQTVNDSFLALSGDDFFQFHVYVGYRFLQRRAEVRLGLLNITDQDYQLHPITFYNELPRERMFTVSLKLNF